MHILLCGRQPSKKDTFDLNELVPLEWQHLSQDGMCFHYQCI